MYKRSIRMLVTVAISAAAVLASGVPSYARPETMDVPGGEVVVSTEDGGTISVPVDGVSKEAWIATYGEVPGDGKLEGTSGSVGVEVSAPATNNRSGRLTSRGSNRGPGGDAINSYGYTDWRHSCGFVSCSVAFRNNYGRFTWLGATPYNANKINGSLKWWVSGVNVSASIPPGAGFSGGGSSVTWRPGSVTNRWSVTLNYASAVNISATITYRAYFTAQADFLFGGTWYHSQGN